MIKSEDYARKIESSFLSTFDKAVQIEPLTLGILKLASVSEKWGNSIRKVTKFTVFVDHIIKVVAVPFIEIGDYFKEISDEKNVGIKILKGTVTPIWLPLRMAVKTACFAVYFFTLGLKHPLERITEIFKFEDPKNSYQQTVDRFQHSFGVTSKVAVTPVKNPWAEKLIVPEVFPNHVLSTIQKVLHEVSPEPQFEKVFLLIAGRGDSQSIPQLERYKQVKTYAGIFGADGPFCPQGDQKNNDNVLVIQIANVPERDTLRREGANYKEVVISFDEYSKLPYEIPEKLIQVLNSPKKSAAEPELLGVGDPLVNSEDSNDSDSEELEKSPEANPIIPSEPEEKNEDPLQPQINPTTFPKSNPEPVVVEKKNENPLQPEANPIISSEPFPLPISITLTDPELITSDVVGQPITPYGLLRKDLTEKAHADFVKLFDALFNHFTCDSPDLITSWKKGKKEKNYQATLEKMIKLWVSLPMKNLQGGGGVIIIDKDVSLFLEQDVVTIFKGISICLHVPIVGIQVFNIEKITWKEDGIYLTVKVLQEDGPFLKSRPEYKLGEKDKVAENWSKGIALGDETTPQHFVKIKIIENAQKK